MLKRKHIEPIIHAVVWLSGYLAIILWVNTLGSFKSTDGTILLPVTIGTLLNICLFYTISLVLIPRYSATKKAGIFLLSSFSLWVGLTALETGIDYLLFINYYSTEDEGFWGQLLINLLFNFIIFSLALGYGFTKSWLRNEKQRQQLKEEMLQAELNFLKAQVNPHFLFNVLNMAYASAAGNGDERTAGIVEKLANLMRYMLYESNVQRVELSRELEYIGSFIELQKMRLSPELQTTVKFIVEGDHIKYKIAPLILIPFVENAFKHGIRLDKPSDILIRLKLNDRQLYFEVQNSIAQARKEPGQKAGGVGLENVKKRLALLYPSTHQLQISRKDDKFSTSLNLKLD
ncbi:sensor histidine kinase [Pontibacter fetidus]|uniref:Signal transduction histidine kinase internal region domain-containing protein n=1 Tax=Pontibacter fetidus TaxID=2700082 RepID=A0A6B2H8K5_9BACT|nr:histidine kinase [Pontibacter fetidus]NDK55732.1 hypothetical protein [Pontibacter fetidus]